MGAVLRAGQVHLLADVDVLRVAAVVGFLCRGGDDVLVDRFEVHHAAVALGDALGLVALLGKDTADDAVHLGVDLRGPDGGHRIADVDDVALAQRDRIDQAAKGRADRCRLAGNHFALKGDLRQRGHAHRQDQQRRQQYGQSLVFSHLGDLHGCIWM